MERPFKLSPVNAGISGRLRSIITFVIVQKTNYSIRRPCGNIFLSLGYERAAAWFLRGPTAETVEPGKETFVKKRKKKKKKAEKEMNVTKSSLFMCALCD